MLKFCQIDRDIFNQGIVAQDAEAKERPVHGEVTENGRIAPYDRDTTQRKHGVCENMKLSDTVSCQSTSARKMTYPITVTNRLDVTRGSWKDRERRRKRPLVQCRSTQQESWPIRLSRIWIR